MIVHIWNYKWMIQLKVKKGRVVDQRKIRLKEDPTRKREDPKKGWMKPTN